MSSFEVIGWLLIRRFNWNALIHLNSFVQFKLIDSFKVVQLNDTN